MTPILDKLRKLSQIQKSGEEEARRIAESIKKTAEAAKKATSPGGAPEE